MRRRHTPTIDGAKGHETLTLIVAASLFGAIAVAVVAAWRTGR